MTSIGAFSDRVVASAARGITRRRMLRDAGGAAFGSALAVAYFGMHADVAQACKWSVVCGPSPLCGGFRCGGPNYAAWQCNNDRFDTWIQTGHGSYDCGGTRRGPNNCWNAPCYRHQVWRCCDCCGNGANNCNHPCHRSSCGSSTWGSCICHAVVASCQAAAAAGCT
jgi:hypothetical protein